MPPVPRTPPPSPPGSWSWTNWMGRLSIVLAPSEEYHSRHRAISQGTVAPQRAQVTSSVSSDKVARCHLPGYYGTSEDTGNATHRRGHHTCAASSSSSSATLRYHSAVI
ncbi:hypothetical protein E2C01_017765 [Portunus trituberculatus]|uniref:Uncharacterized protein n=1 Tax=Portunus trituberculatus TaxID=210409 RepID=A0A5B7DTE0_PORTR|nr:hypothetical protein [Portunus trituberculatus]